MTISGIPPSLGAASGLVPGLGRPRPEESAADPTHLTPSRQAPPPSRRPTPEAAAGAASGTLPTEAPPGTDPALWEVLSAEERAFFARARSMGPLTYGPGAPRRAELPPSLQGGRIDVRV